TRSPSTWTAAASSSAPSPPAPCSPAPSRPAAESSPPQTAARASPFHSQVALGHVLVREVVLRLRRVVLAPDGFSTPSRTIDATLLRGPLLRSGVVRNER